MDEQDISASEIKEEYPGETSVLSVQPTVMILHLKDGRSIPIEPGGMVDIAIHELGARIVDIEELDTNEAPIAHQTK